MTHPGTLHRYTSRLCAFEHTPTSPSIAPPSTSIPTPLNTLLWVGGLGDGLLTVRYPSKIASSLPSDWRIAEVLLTSSYNGWGTGSLQRDAQELDRCAAYFKSLDGRQSGKIVLMGHSTGCQDIMEYLVGKGCEDRTTIDGAVLQAGVSDREGWADMTGKEGKEEELESVVDMAKELVEKGREREILPMGNVVVDGLGDPVSAYRAWSLLSKGGDDDYFSSDLEDDVLEATFGKIPKETKVCILFGGMDQYVPANVDKEALLKRWTEVVRKGGGVVDERNGGVVPGASHNLNKDPEEVVADLVGRVVRFLEGFRGEAGSSRL